jgi:hypothetical protein
VPGSPGPACARPAQPVSRGLAVASGLGFSSRNAATRRSQPVFNATTLMPERRVVRHTARGSGARPGEPSGQIAPRPTHVRVRVREQQVAREPTLWGVAPRASLVSQPFALIAASWRRSRARPGPALVADRTPGQSPQVRCPGPRSKWRRRSRLPPHHPPGLVRFSATSACAIA